MRKNIKKQVFFSKSKVTLTWPTEHEKKKVWAVQG